MSNKPRDSQAIGVRIKNQTVDEIIIRANRRGISFNAWINRAISQGLRSHKKKGK